ncbi:MAG: hypothetical protein P8178_06325 [Candidatus Thiodiazotropha sp.]
MITLKQTLLAATLGLCVAAPAFASHGHEKSGLPEHVAQRMEHQQARIARGIRTRRLTHKEAHVLKRQQREIRELARRYGRDHRYSHKEVSNLERRLDKAGLMIRRLVRNDLTRYVDLHQRYGHADHHREL